MLKLCCTYRTGLIIIRKLFLFEIGLCLNIAKIKQLVSDSQSLNQHRLLGHVGPDFQFASLRLTPTMVFAETFHPTL